MTVEEAERQAAPVEGFVNETEGRLLYELASKCHAGPVVEIGSWKGKSTIWLAIGARDNGCGKVYAVDPHQGSKDHEEKGESSTFEEFKSNIDKAGVQAEVVPLVMCSAEARNEVPCPIGLLFLDGPTEEDEIMAELDRWRPCMSEGSIVAIHDSLSMPGPRNAVEHVYLSSKYTDVGLAGSITYAKVVDEAGLVAKLRDMSHLTLKRIELILGRLNYPEPIRQIGRRALSNMRTIE